MQAAPRLTVGRCLRPSGQLLCGTTAPLPPTSLALAAAAHRRVTSSQLVAHVEQRGIGDIDDAEVVDIEAIGGFLAADCR